MITQSIFSVLDIQHPYVCVEKELEMRHHVTAAAQQDVSESLMTSVLMNCRSKQKSIFYFPAVNRGENYAQIYTLCS